jgi:bacteriorhodopsin
MAENLRWLYYAFGFGWALVFLYLFWISRQEQALRKKVAALQALLEEKAQRSR